MTFNIKNTLIQMQTYLKKTGLFEDVLIGEPKSGLGYGNKLAAAVYMQNASHRPITFQRADETMTVMVRIYRSMLAEPSSDIEIDIAGAVSRIGTDLMGDFNLASNVETLRFAGDAAVLDARWGYVEVSGTMFRVADITIPLLVDDEVTVAS